MARKSWTTHDDDGDSRDDDVEDGDMGSHFDLDDHDAADRARFSSETAQCPECGAEVWDAADICPKCFAWIDGDTRTHQRRGVHHPVFRQSVLWVLIGAMVLGGGLFGFLGLHSCEPSRNSKTTLTR